MARNCVRLWDLIDICEGDNIVVYPRGTRAMLGVRGVVKGISGSGLMLEAGDHLILFRLSEIRMVEVLSHAE